MSQGLSAKSQEEYEDDFEKDLDWLISEEGHSEDQGSDYKDIEAEIDKELEDHDDQGRGGKEKKSQNREKSGKESKEAEVEEDEERWPSPMEPLEYSSDRDSPFRALPIAPPPLASDNQPEEEKKYILEKIQWANQELQDQEAPDTTRRKRLHFKDMLVDMVVPPFGYQKSGDDGAPRRERVEGQDGSTEGAESEVEEREVSGKLSELKISPRPWERSDGEWSGQGGPEVKEDRVLVEKDGKFDLVSLKEVDSQGLLPPLANNSGSQPRSSRRPRESALGFSRIQSSPSSSSPRPLSQQGIEHLWVPRPPAQPRNRPNSASHGQRGSPSRGARRRVHSATGTSCQMTFTLSPQQKEQLQKIQERKARREKEAEERKREEEEQRKRENEVAFRAWLMKKRGQLQEERRIHRAQEMERMNSNVYQVSSDREEVFKSWLQRKQEQQQRERQLEELRRLEQESSYLLHNRQQCERAFKLWLKRKWVEKRAEQQAARERSRRLVLEERHARRTQDLLLCTVNDNKPFRFT
ncbi:coiled-coil domain-containing protein 181 [Lampris incognitus]|uniref:coiled-coil domain-containing protein 181 n=1 Tax=Lampris incognitus TaxID=2546036 RepID=UPI0024B50821|nr:coiled-coil domain-containing protein 181 [Lampris incognitus]